MYKKPNEYITKIKSSDKLNLLGRRFEKIFSVLLNPSYYEGTKYAEYFDGVNEDGTSDIYVKDSLELELQEFIDSNNNGLKYLVGLTGMGKTTLLRNFFKIRNRDVLSFGNKHIIYISFYYSNLSTDKPYQSIQNEVANYLERFVRVLLKDNKEIIHSENKFWSDFYNFIERSKPILVSRQRITPLNNDLFSVFANPSYQEIKKILADLCQDLPVEYYSLFIKYILDLINKKYRIIIVFDDIESKPAVFHKQVVEIARHMLSCFEASETRLGVIKVIVSLRAYTFRCNIERQAEARREALLKDVILKKTTVSLHDIFCARFDAIEKKENLEKNVKKIDKYKAARETFFYVEKQLDEISSGLVYDLVNCNLCDAMLTYSLLLTNLQWIAIDEREFKGAFILDGDSYRITTVNVINAIGMGNSKYYEGKNELIPNIIQYGGMGTELFPLYIIRYMIIHKFVDIYGNIYIDGKNLLNNLTDVFLNGGILNINENDLRSTFRKTISYMYNEGILFRSLYDIEEINESQIERNYDDSYKLYLSPKGRRIYKMLSDNSVLMELYRDDIETDLKNNDKITSSLSEFETLKYRLQNLNRYFEYEKTMISKAIYNLNSYIECFGNEFLTSYILEGVIKNTIKYYGDKNVDYKKVVSLCKDLIQSMTDYSDLLLSKYGVKFNVTDQLNEYFNKIYDYIQI